MKKILIVDFQQDYAQTLQDRLFGLCKVVVCQHRDELPDIIFHEQPDYLILDFTDSEFEGFTVLRSALLLGANPAVIGIIENTFFYNTMCNKEKNITSTVVHPVSPALIASRISFMMELQADQLVPVPTRKEFVNYMLKSLGIPTDWAGGMSLLTIIPLAADHP